MKPIKPGSYHFYDHCWKANIHLLWKADNNDLSKYMKRTFSVDYRSEVEADGKCLEVLDCDDVQRACVIYLADWKADPRWISVLSHECLHATHQILSVRSLEMNNASVEVFTYLHESIMSRCLEVLLGKTPPDTFRSRPISKKTF